MRSPSSPPLLVYFSLAIKLPIFQDIKFEFRESQTSCNHSLVLQCIFNKSHRTCKKKKRVFSRAVCLLRRRRVGKKSCVMEAFSQNQGNSRPDTDTSRSGKMGTHPPLRPRKKKKKESSSLKERKEEEQGVSLHYRVKTFLFRMDSGEAHRPSSYPSDITALSRGQSSFSDC